MLKSAFELAFEKKNSLLMSTNEEEKNKDSDSDASQRPLAHSNDEHKKLIGVQPPILELLAEFPIIDGTVSETCYGQKVTRGLVDTDKKSSSLNFKVRC